MYLDKLPCLQSIKETGGAETKGVKRKQEQVESILK